MEKTLIDNLKGWLFFTFIFGAIAFGILGVSHLIYKNVNGTDLLIFVQYFEFIKLTGLFLYHRLDVIAILWTLYFGTHQLSVTKYNLMEQIRERQFQLEVNRWAGTPFIAPLHYYYLLTPQATEAFQPSWLATYHNKFYHLVLCRFRDVVYIDKDFHQTQPGERASIWKVVGSKNLLEMTLCTIMIFVYIGVISYNYSLDAFVHGYARFTLGLVGVFMYYIFLKIQAIVIAAPWSKVDYILMNAFGELEPKITWRDCFPDRHDDVITKAYAAEWERRYRYLLEFTKIPPKDIEPSLPRPPYPDKVLPPHAGIAEMVMNERIQELNAQAVVKPTRAGKEKSNVVLLDRSRKY